jgi:hypothetical protein
MAAAVGTHGDFAGVEGTGRRPLPFSNLLIRKVTRPISNHSLPPIFPQLTRRHLLHFAGATIERLYYLFHCARRLISTPFICQSFIRDGDPA